MGALNVLWKQEDLVQTSHSKVKDYTAIKLHCSAVIINFHGSWYLQRFNTMVTYYFLPFLPHKKKS